MKSANNAVKVPNVLLVLTFIFLTHCMLPNSRFVLFQSIKTRYIWPHSFFFRHMHVLTVERRRETELEWSWPLKMFAISCIGPPLDKISHSDLISSSLRKSKSRLGETGTHTEVAALKRIPGGSPESSTFFLVMILTSSSMLPISSLLHFCEEEAHTPLQKFSVILCASFSILFFPIELMAAAFSKNKLR